MRNLFVLAAFCLAVVPVLQIQAQQRTSHRGYGPRSERGRRCGCLDRCASPRNQDLGEYEVTAEKTGFKVSKHEAVRLEVDREAVVNYRLSRTANSALLPINGVPKFNRGLHGHDVRHA